MLQLQYHKKESEVIEREDITEEERKVLSVMDIEARSMEEIYGRIKEDSLGLTLVKTMEAVLQLRMKKLVGEKDGYYFVLEKI